MNTRKALSIAMAGLMLAGPVVASAATTSSSQSTKPASTACKGLSGKALKDCKAKLKVSGGK